MDRLLEDLRKPDASYYPRPLWFWNGKPDKAGIQRIMEKSQSETGYAGFGILAYQDCGLAYMGEEYLSLYREVLETAKKLGMKICLYDEWWFPSGNAGGILKERYPDACAKRLDKEEYKADREGRLVIELREEPLMAAVRMNDSTKERENLRGRIEKGDFSQGNLSQGNLSLGKISLEGLCPEDTVYLFYCVMDGWDHVDYLDPEAVRKFIEVTHEVYYREFSEYFGTVIDSTFYDEPQFYTPKGRMWTPNFNQKFRERNGYDPDLLYPALWYDIGEETDSARVALLGFRAQLYAEGFPGTIREWCHSHGIVGTGHVDQEEMINPAGITGDLMKSFQYQDIPGVDEISSRYRGGKIYKIVSSSAYNWDKPLVMTETFGAMGEDIGEDGLYGELMEQFSKGINYIVPHAVWYDNEEHVVFPPELSYRSQRYGKMLGQLSLYSARASRLLQGGIHRADIGVLYPIASLQAAYYMDWGEPYHGGPVRDEFDYQEIGRILSDEIRKDYTFLHPEVLNGSCLIEKEQLILDNPVNRESYQVLIVPGGKVIDPDNMRKIRDFWMAGGRVIFTSALPEKSSVYGRDQEVVTDRDQIFAGAEERDGILRAKEKRAWFIKDPVLLDTVLSETGIVFDVSVQAEEPQNGVFSYIHKILDGRDIYFFANSGNKRISAEVEIRGEKELVLFDPHTGRDVRLQTRTEGQVTRFTLDMEPVHSVFLIECPVSGCNKKEKEMPA